MTESFEDFPQSNQPSNVWNPFTTIKRTSANVEALCLVQAGMGFVNGVLSTELSGFPKVLMYVVEFVPTFLRSIPISQFFLFNGTHFLTTPMTHPTFYTAPLWNLAAMTTNLCLQRNFPKMRDSLENFLSKFKTHSSEIEILSLVFYISPFAFYTMGNILGRRCAPIFQTWAQERAKFMFHSAKHWLNKN
jgi:hypothetical protein